MTQRDTNLKGAFNTIRHMSRYFLKQKSGRIINISSVSGILGNAGQANYSASKAGVIGLCNPAIALIHCLNNSDTSGWSQRACQPGNHSKRSGTGLCRDRDDRCACRCGKGESFITDSAWQTGKHKGYRKRSIIFSIRCSRLHHRPGAVC